MIIEENTDLEEKKLNIIYALSYKDFGNESFIKIVDSDTYFNNYHGSDYFRFSLLKKGYKIKTLFNVYHQGWECDQWAAIIIKDNKEYYTYTDHGSLCFEEQKESFFSMFKKIL